MRFFHLKGKAHARAHTLNPYLIDSLRIFFFEMRVNLSKAVGKNSSNVESVMLHFRLRRHELKVTHTNSKPIYNKIYKL